ncbi:alpha/beta hydrolase [Reichenbachiella agarivorans]|uniref:Alpha/beta hydrolase n=1 Tax=Reichenbachiella agarivorans TaxID=2979464 RepID=A0ABY6CRG3_9BACT|nr:alpha/beta hydrolase [Reichenbachiella agarivorans]UXP33097.1 alpha/beta hydrolase [Reichenbachiella agarivorans]
MKKIAPLFTLLAFIVFASCLHEIIYSDDTQFAPYQQNPPFTLPDNSTFYQNIPYDQHERNQLDIFLPAPSNGNSSPLLIIIHGGGFVQGDKKQAYSSSYHRHLINNLLSKNIAVSTINYRYVDDNGGIMRSINDCKRALQFIKHHRDSLGINSSKIILMGSSAGAGTALYIGLSSDLADLTSAEPILHQSTQVLGVIGTETQATYDIAKWDQLVFSTYQTLGFNHQDIISIIGKSRIEQYLGAKDTDVNSDETWGSHLDILSLMTTDDPEIYIANQKIANSVPTNSSELYHHPLHAKVLMDKAKEAGLSSRFYIPELDIDTRDEESIEDFILRKLL